MAGFWEPLIELVKLLWPFRIVAEWEEACYYRFGKYWKTVGKGMYLVLPWFFSLHEVSIQPAIISTGRCDITLADGRELSFDATAWARVADTYKAINTVDDYRETSQEILASVMADKLGEVDPERLKPAKRGRLFSDLRKWVAEEAAEKGIEISKVRFKSFVFPKRTYRLLIDQGPAPMSW